MRLKPLVILCLCAALFGCEDKPTEQAEAEEPRPQRPQDVIAHAHARDAVGTALVSAVKNGFRRAELKARNMQPPAVPDEYDAASPTLTVLFGANNHGEREDCGCKANPLGGLTRRATLINASAANDEVAKKWWGDGAGTKEFVVVDAGDSLFKNSTLDKGHPDAQAQAKYDAESVVQALAASPLDAYNIGENDLVFGTNELKRLQKIGDIPFISANLLDAKSQELLFPGHVVVERQGLKVGIIGLTKVAPRAKDYYSKRKVAIKSTDLALEEETKAVGDVDIILLLSNLGMADTRDVISAQKGKKPAVVFVSNSNKLTVQPEWVDGIPLVEPLSRGKYYGRVNIFRKGSEPLQYRNVAVDPRRAIQEYRRGWSAYVSARKQYWNNLREIAKLELELSKTTPDAGLEAETQKRLKSRKAFLTRESKRVESRLDVASTSLNTAAGELMTLDRDLSKDAKGDDWIETNVIQVKLEIPEANAERKILDKREAKRPDASKKRRGKK